MLVEVLPRVRDIRRQGAAALDLCSVACGRLDAYYERGLAPWDLAAGGLIATEAGAVVTDFDGDPRGAGAVVAAAPGIAVALRELLATTGGRSRLTAIGDGGHLSEQVRDPACNPIATRTAPDRRSRPPP